MKKDKIIELLQETSFLLGVMQPSKCPNWIKNIGDCKKSECKFCRVQKCIDTIDSLAELLEVKEDNASVFLIERDTNSAKLYKNGKRISPEEFTEFYNCELTIEQKKLLEVIKKDYFNALSEVKESVTDEEIGFDILKRDSDIAFKQTIQKLIDDKPDKELFEKVYIKSETDLPEEGIFIIHHKKGHIGISDLNLRSFKNDIDWYLYPIPAQSPLTDEEIEKWVYDESEQNINGDYERGIALGKLLGAKAYRDGLIAEWLIKMYNTKCITKNQENGKK